LDFTKTPIKEKLICIIQMKQITTALLKWYRQKKRQLPFRSTKDPYKIWVSEVMLQQTQVSTVIPFYKKWIKQFPTLSSVAISKPGILLKQWEGLGYYRRCGNFHKASKIIVENHNGIIPSDYDTFKSLPGVGDYTAGAVLSIAFGKAFPAIDGNVTRVIARLYGMKNLTKFNKLKIKNFIELLLPQTEPGNFNQSLMELGALVCRPKSPKCSECPISGHCKAFQSLVPENYPKIFKKKIKPHYNVVTGIFWRKNKFYIQKRSRDSMLGGLWEFPGGKVENNESLENALIRELQEETGSTPIIKKKIISIDHAYSHFSITLHCYHCIEKDSKIIPRNNSNWISTDEIDKYSFPKANHKIFNFLNENGWDI